MLQSRIIDHNCVKFVSFFKASDFSEEFSAAFGCKIKCFRKVGSFEEGFEFDAVILDDSVLPHPQELNLAERMERAVYLGLDEKDVAAKFVAGRKIF